MVSGIVDALNPFQQDFSEAEDFINILRQANAPFSSFDEPLINELLPLQQVADSWIQLALQSFGFGSSPLTTAGRQDPNSVLAGALPSVIDSPASAPGPQEIGGLFAGAPLSSVPALISQTAGALFAGAPLASVPAPITQALGGFFAGAALSSVPTPGLPDTSVLFAGAPLPSFSA
jgi:hypothetical protein